MIFLRGGPGVPDMAGDAAFLRPLSDEGFDVYVYDEIGSGGSTRLVDPTRYTVPRDVADLEHVRTLIGADQLVLVGHSYGGLLYAADYLAAHPDHVAKLVLISPQSLDPADRSDGRVPRHGSSRNGFCASGSRYSRRGRCWATPCCRSTRPSPTPTCRTPRPTRTTTRC